MKPRVVLIATVAIATGLATVAGFLVGYRASPTIAWTRLWVDLGLMICLLVATTALTRSFSTARQDIADAIRRIAVGARDVRLAAERFGDLTDVAAAVNELAGALTDDLDPNLGAVRSRPRVDRTRPVATGMPPQTASTSSSTAALTPRSMPKVLSGGEGVGEPRPLRGKTKERAEVRDILAPSAADDESALTASAGTEAPTEPERPAAPQPQPPEPVATAVATGTPRMAEPMRASDPPAGERIHDDAADVPVVDLLRQVFAQFIAAKEAHAEPIDEFSADGFVETLLAEYERLRVRHKCRDVKFEVTVQDGEVSLQPRLIR